MSHAPQGQPNEYDFGTNAIHAGQVPDPHTGAVTMPISLSSTFAQTSPGVKYPANYEYSRSSNPTRKALEDCLAELEKGTFGFAFSSGLAATSTIVSMLKAGDHIVCVDDVYGGTQRYFRNVSTKFGIETTFCDFNNEKELRAAIRADGSTKLVWLETPTNPTLTVTDVARTAAIVHEHAGAVLVVDNTFASPYFQRPLELGADIVMHSATKYLGGHSDVVMGVAVTRDEALAERLRYLQNSMGAVPSAFDAFLVLRSLKTLHVRMQRHAENAQALAEFLESDAAKDKVARVAYPGLPSHPQHDIAKRQMKGFSGMITIWLRGGIDQARAFLENVKVFTLAESLGGVESLAESPAIMTHASVPAEQRRKLGIDDSMVRLSVGIEDISDLLDDVRNALAHVKV